jgi:hypothetical protein
MVTAAHYQSNQAASEMTVMFFSSHFKCI